MSSCLLLPQESSEEPIHSNPLGSSQAIYSTKHAIRPLDGEGDCITALELACGDPRNVLFTVACEEG